MITAETILQAKRNIEKRKGKPYFWEGFYTGLAISVIIFCILLLLILPNLQMFS